jgi:hypothetical protein
VWHNFNQQLFEVNINTGIEQMLPMPEASQGSVSPDGKYTAYIRSVDVMNGRTLDCTAVEINCASGSSIMQRRY